MEQKYERSALKKFFLTISEYPVLTGLSAGLYPIIFYYSKKFSLVNSWEQLGFFTIIFLGIPIFSCILFNWLFKTSALKKYKKYVLPFLNLFFFLFFLKMCLFVGVQKKMIIGILIISLLFAKFFFKHSYKLIVFQLILAFVGSGALSLVVMNNLNYSVDWMLQPDDIEKVIFKKTPNVYYIQPDGYVNFSELKKGHYNIDNRAFEKFLDRNGFVSYLDFRSNYSNTMSSNSSIFTMKHHYYNLGEDGQSKIEASSIITSKNIVLDVFKKNGYKTHFLTEVSYFFLNRPKLGYDVCNFDRSEIPFFYKGFKERKSIIPSLEKYLEEDKDRHKFFFLEILAPWHIKSNGQNSAGQEGEKKIWRKSLDESNQILKEAIGLILKNDPNALIIIMADHGGFVGLDFTKQLMKKSKDRNTLYSAFSSILSVHWPYGDVPVFDSDFKSAVNVFRILFSYLSENEKYLLQQEDNSSYLILKEPSPGAYKCIDEAGNIVFKKHPGD
jgi:hypothetical protein